LAPHGAKSCMGPVINFIIIIIVIEMSGVWGEQAMSLVKELGRRMAEVNKEPRSTMFLRQRLSIAVQRGKAACILGTLRPVVGGSY